MSINVSKLTSAPPAPLRRQQHPADHRGERLGRLGFATHTVGEVIAEVLGGSAFVPHSTVTAGYVSREPQLIPALVRLLRATFPTQESEK